MKDKNKYLQNAIERAERFARERHEIIFVVDLQQAGYEPIDSPYGLFTECGLSCDPSIQETDIVHVAG